MAGNGPGRLHLFLLVVCCFAVGPPATSRRKELRKCLPILVGRFGIPAHLKHSIAPSGVGGFAVGDLGQQTISSRLGGRLDGLIVQ